MHLRQKLAAIAWTLLLTVDVSAQNNMRPGGPLTLQAAVAAGIVDYTFTGTGASSGDSIKLTVRKTAKAGSGPVMISVPPGTLLRSSSARAQNMVVSAVRGIAIGVGLVRPLSQITLTGTASVSVILSAFCAEFQKDNPSEFTNFSIEKPDPVLACLTKNSRGQSLAVQQAAVWIHTDNVTYRSMSAKFEVELGEFAAAEKVVERCRATVR